MPGRHWRNLSKECELIEPHDDDKRYTRRNQEGEFTNSQDDVGQSPSQDRRKATELR